MMWQQRLGRRVASTVISPYHGNRGFSRVGFDFKGIFAKASARTLSSLPLPLLATPEKWRFQHEPSLHQAWSGPGLSLGQKDVFLIGIDGRGSLWLNHLSQFRHHSSSSARGRGGKGQEYTQVGGPIDASVCNLSESEIHNLLSTRNQCRRKRDFQRADSILEKLRRCGVEFDDRAKTWRADGKLLMPRMSDCQTMEEAIRAIHDNLEKASPRDMAAFWTVVPKLLNRQQGRSQKQPLVPQLNATFIKTADRLGNYGQRDLVTTALSFAKIIKILEQGRGRHVGGSYEEFLRGILVDRKKVIFKFIGKHTIPILSQIEPRYLSNLAYACAIAGCVPELEDGSTLFHHLAEKNILLLGRFEPQGLSNMIWAFATAGVSHPLLFKKMADHIVGLDHLGAFKPQALSNTLWAFAKAEVLHTPLFEKVANHIASLDNLDEFKPQELANTIWAFEKAGASYPPLFERVADHILGLDHLGAFKPQELANTIWAFAKTEVSHPPLLEKVANHIVGLDHLGEFYPQALSNIVWAYATAGVSHIPLFEKLADHLAGLDNLVSYDPQDLANIVWAFAKAEISHHVLFDKVADHIVRLGNLEEFKPQAFANIVGAFVKAGVSHPPLFEKVADHIASLDNLEKFKPQNLSNIVWAFAKAEMSHPGLFGKIAHHIVSLDNLEAFNRQNIKNLIWGFAKAGVKNVELFDKLADVALDKEDEFTARDIANILRWTK